MQRNLAIVAGVLLGITALYYAWRWLSAEREVPPAQLATEALTAPSPKEKTTAALRLSGHKSRQAAPELHRVLRESKQPQVRATSIQGLASRYYYESMPSLLDALEDPSPLVRARAGAAVAKLLQADFGFRYNDPPERRAGVIKVIRQEWDRMKGSQMLEDWKRRLERRRKGR